MGRKQIEIKKIEHEKTRLITFHKRRKGLLKKAMELSILCDCQVKIVITEENGDAIVYQSTEELDIPTTQENANVTSLTNEDYSKLFPPLPQLPKPTHTPRAPRIREQAPALLPTPLPQQQAFFPLAMPNMMPYGFFPGAFMPQMFVVPTTEILQQETNVQTIPPPDIPQTPPPKTTSPPLKRARHNPPIQTQMPQTLTQSHPTVESTHSTEASLEIFQATDSNPHAQITPSDESISTDCQTQPTEQLVEEPLKKSAKVQGLSIQIPQKNHDLCQPTSQLSSSGWQLFSPGPLSLGLGDSFSGLTPFSAGPRTPTFGQFYSLNSPQTPHFS